MKDVLVDRVNVTMWEWNIDWMKERGGVRGLSFLEELVP